MLPMIAFLPTLPSDEVVSMLLTSKLTGAVLFGTPEHFGFIISYNFIGQLCHHNLALATGLLFFNTS